MWPYLSLFADCLMIAASAGAGVYCLVLSRRLSRLTSFDTGIGAAIAVLSAQVEEMKTALTKAKEGSDGASTQLGELVRQARDISAELELMIAACHDFAEDALVAQSRDAPGPGSLAPPGQAPAPPVDAVDPIPIFGTRRQPPPEPVFRHQAQA